jgi:hypothetical protein
LSPSSSEYLHSARRPACLHPALKLKRMRMQGSVVSTGQVRLEPVFWLAQSSGGGGGKELCSSVGPEHNRLVRVRTLQFGTRCSIMGQIWNQQLSSREDEVVSGFSSAAILTSLCCLTQSGIPKRIGFECTFTFSLSQLLF